MRYETSVDLLDRIRATYSEYSQTSTDGLLEEYRRASLLIIDDLGAEKGSEWAEERLYALVDERYRNGRRLLVASNLSVAMLAQSRVGSRLMDVANGVARQVIIQTGNKR